MKTAKLMLLFAILAAPIISEAGVNVDVNGWTVVTPSADSRIVYVAANGNNANNGLSAATPKQTIHGATGGNSLIRDGFPDHLLLRRGDTFVTDSNTLYRWKNGRSATEPVLLSYYGSTGARPIVKIVDQLIDHNGQIRNYQAVIGLDIYKSVSDPTSPDFTNVSCTPAFRFVGGGANLLIEDCRLRYCTVTVQTYTDQAPGAVYTGFKLRRNIILDPWMHNSWTSEQVIVGLFVSGVRNYTIEENFFDHCGWSEHPSLLDARANKFNHNVYVQYDNAEGGIMRGNILARGAAHGMQARSGGIVERNLAVLNAVGINVGGVQTPTDPDVLSYPNALLDNVVLNGRKMHPTDSGYPRSNAVWGLSAPLGLIPGVYVDGNIIANRLESGDNAAFEGDDIMDFGSNISYNWDPVFDTTNPSWPHPADDLGDYNASIGGSNSTIAYLQTQRDRPIRTLNWSQTAYAAINYIRAGFNYPSIAGYYTYPGGGGTPAVTIIASDASAGEGSNPGEFRVTANPTPASTITVNLTRTGTASNGSDYSNIPLTVNVGTSGTATIPVSVTDDVLVESTETVILTLASGTGYTVASPNTATVNIADNDSATSLPSPWITQDIGAVSATGSASYSNGTFTVIGSGADIWNLADEFRFVHQSASGDCEIRARVVSIQNTSSGAKAGVMIRETTGATSKHAFMEITPPGPAEFIRRVSTGGGSTYTAGGMGTAPYWVRVVRTAGTNTFTAYKSSNGSTWGSPVGSITISMSSSVRIGLAVTSGNDGTLCTAVFDNVTVTP